MIVKPNVLKALEKVASLSADSAALVEQLKPKTNPEAVMSNPEKTVATLNSKITQLNSELNMLRIMLIPVDDPLPDSEIEEFTNSLYDHLDKSENIKTALAGYRRDFFAPYSPRVRAAIATALLNYCTKNDLSASDLWRDIIANMGHL